MTEEGPNETSSVGRHCHTDTLFKIETTFSTSKRQHHQSLVQKLPRIHKILKSAMFSSEMCQSIGEELVALETVQSFDIDHIQAIHATSEHVTKN